MIYFTADCHFWHENAIIHNERPFENAVVMNDKLNGTKHLIIGNHDRKPVYKIFETHQDYLELEYNNIYFIL